MSQGEAGPEHSTWVPCGHAELERQAALRPDDQLIPVRAVPRWTRDSGEARWRRRRSSPQRAMSTFINRFCWEPSHQDGVV